MYHLKEFPPLTKLFFRKRTEGRRKKLSQLINLAKMFVMTVMNYLKIGNIVYSRGVYLGNRVTYTAKKGKENRHARHTCGEVTVGNSHHQVKKGKVCIRAKWPIRPELISVSVA